MERRFQPIHVEPPSRDEALEILTGLRDTFEAHHRVRISDAALEASVDLSIRYISNRFLPDKAIDVLDEACSSERLERTTRPPDVTAVEETIEQLEREKNEAVFGQDFELAAEVRDKLESAKAEKERVLLEWKKSTKEVDGAIDADAIRRTIASMTGIPAQNIQEEEKDRLKRIEEYIHQTVISQDHAIASVAKAIRRSRAGLRDPNRPLGSYIFVGPSGVGKTLVAKALANFLFGSEDALLTIDMSEYMEKHSVSRLVGSPPGYVGYEEGGQLTEKIRRKPYMVVLLDEVEKAHPDVLNTLLQVLEEGRLTDSFGRQVDFRNTIVIMTSNLGVSELDTRSPLGFNSGDESIHRENTRDQMLEVFRGHFRPEFLNRVDELVIFDPFSHEELGEILALEVKKLEQRLQHIELSIVLDDEAVELLIRLGSGPHVGARGIRRVLEEQIQDQIADLILEGTISEGGCVKVTLNDRGKILVEAHEENPVSEGATP